MPDLLKAQLRHAIHYQSILSQASQLYLQGGESISQGLTQFDLERINIESGQAWASRHIADDVQIAQLTNDYSDVGAYVLFLRLHLREQIRWHEAALAAARQLKSQDAEGKHLGNLAIAYRNLGDLDKTIALYEQRLEIAQAIGDRLSEGKALGGLGNTYFNLRDYGRAIDFYKQWLQIAQEVNDWLSVGQALGNLGSVYFKLGEFHKSAELYEQRLWLARDMNDRRGEGIALGSLGNVYDRLGEPQNDLPPK